jgi:hypothetical protein
MKIIKNEFLSSPILIILLVFLLPPLGLVLLGNHPRLSIVAKISTGLIVSIFLILFFFQYQWSPKLPSNKLSKIEQLTYEFINIEYSNELNNSLNEPVQAETEHYFVKLFFSVENIGEKTIFYASLIDQPQLIGDQQNYAPDLTLSREPFGNLGSKKKAEGYLVFEVPIKEKLHNFIIADQEFSLQP